ncbi:MAG TPA: HK97-gp10 family putative phage morphogenesis protein [Actinokineospora sp.]|jgi:HK97 gp10 family phage protein|nr:HK97-gp10 family putative phage morphogenesis protein [Actinokineospora sp.]
MRMRLHGAAELRAALARLSTVVVDVGAEALTDWADDVGDDAETDVAVDTGYLQVQIEKRVDVVRLVAEVGVWDEHAAYAEHVEKGTSSMPARPFLLPAFEAHRNIRPYIKAALERHLR